MKPQEILDSLLSGKIGRDEALKKLIPVQDLGFAKIDLHRQQRKGFAEAVFGENKSLEQLITITGSFFEAGQPLLITRISPDMALGVVKRFPQVQLHPQADCLSWKGENARTERPGFIAVVSAGTSDQKVAEEAVVTLEHMGSRGRRFFDVGVAGVHRLLNNVAEIKSAVVIVVVAGMDGVLPSLVGGLVDRPVIAVPTSIGYGASFDGLSALLTMLNSCAPGVTVVNIDNGFGGGYAAALIHKSMAAKLMEEKN